MFRSCIVALIVLVVAAVTLAQQVVPAPTPAPAALVANRIIVRVADLQQSIAFYRDLVGLPVQSTFEEFAVFDGGGGVTLMLQQVPNKEPSSGLTAMTEVVLESSDVLASYRAMKSRGVVFRIEPRLVTTDGRTRALYAADFRDPDGHVLSISGWLPREK